MNKDAFKGRATITRHNLTYSRKRKKILIAVYTAISSSLSEEMDRHIKHSDEIQNKIQNRWPCIERQHSHTKNEPQKNLTHTSFLLITLGDQELAFIIRKHLSFGVTIRES